MIIVVASTICIAISYAHTTRTEHNSKKNEESRSVPTRLRVCHTLCVHIRISHFTKNVNKSFFNGRIVGFGLFKEIEFRFLPSGQVRVGVRFDRSEV